MWLAACGAAPKQKTTPEDEKQVVEMEPMRITASRDGTSGDFDLEAYDASDLFERATEHLDQNECEKAVALYDKLHAEFESSRYVSAALYNAGLCLGRAGELDRAIARYTTLIEELPQSRDVKHALFQATELLLEAERWEPALQRADQLLAREDLSPEGRMEALARRAQALLGAERIDDAREQARQALTYSRRQEAEGEPVKDIFFRAAASFVLAETTRLRSQNLTFPSDTTEAQREVLMKKAELLLEAQRQYFDTIRLRSEYWTAAAGYRIGHMYDHLWHAIMESPIPASVPAQGHDIYRQELAKLIKPLLRHAIRYWEVTLMMVERTGVKTPWAAKTREDLDRMRELILEQPEGRGGLEANRDETADDADASQDGSGEQAEANDQTGPKEAPASATDEQNPEPVRAAPDAGTAGSSLPAASGAAASDDP